MDIKARLPGCAGQSSRRSKDKIQESSDYLFWFSIGHRVMDHRSGDGRIRWMNSKSSRSVFGKNFRNFEMLDAKIASALNKIILNSQFKKKVSLEEQAQKRRVESHEEDKSLSWSTTYFRVTDAHDTVLDYPDLFSVIRHDDNIQEFDTRWDEVLLSLTKIPSDDVLESLYKLRMRESAQLKTVLEWYDMEIHQKISMPNCQKLKTMVKRNMN